jgi:hypothetical protein
MPDHIYQVDHIIGGNAVQVLNEIIQQLQSVDGLQNMIKPKFVDLFKGMPASVNSAAKAIDKLGKAMIVTDAAVIALIKNIRTLNNAALAATNSVTGFQAAMSKAGSQGNRAASTFKNTASSLASTSVAAASAATSATASATAMEALRAASSKAATQGNRAAKSFNNAAVGITRAGAAAGASASNFSALSGMTLKVGTSTNKTSGLVNGLTTRFLGLAAARTAIHSVYEASQELEERWEKLAEDAEKFRGSLRELASLKNEKGPNDRVAAEALDVALKARMKPDEAVGFMQAYENIGPAVRLKKHYQPLPGQGSPEELEKNILAEAANTGKRLGVDQNVAGAAIGQAMLLHPASTVEQAMQQFGGALKGIQAGNLKYGSGLSYLTGAAAKLVNPEHESMTDEEKKDAEGSKAGRLESYAEAGEYMGALSLGIGGADAAGKSAHRMVQNSRVLNPSSKNEKGRAALQAAGINDTMTDPEKLIRLSDYFKEQKIGDPNEWLVASKLGTDATREGMVASLKQVPVLRQRLESLKKGAKTNAAGKELMGANTEFKRTDVASSADAVKSETEVLNKVVGLEGAAEFESAKEHAEVIQRLENPHYNSWTDTIVKKAWSPFTYLGSGVSGAARVDEKIAINTLQNEGKRVGVDVARDYPDLFVGSYEKRASAFKAASAAVRAKGGDPLNLMGSGKRTSERVKRLGDSAPPLPGAGALPAGAGAAGAAAGIPAGAAAGVPGAAAMGDGRSGTTVVAMSDPRLTNLNARQLAALEVIAANTRRLGGESGGGIGYIAPGGGGGFEPFRT